MTNQINSLTDDLMKNLWSRMCMKEDNPGPESISREITSTAGRCYPFVIWLAVLVLNMLWQILLILQKLFWSISIM